VQVDCPEGLLVSHDRKWTTEALFNILDNAVKYTPEGGNIRVSVECWEMYVKIDITDNGIGISAADLPRVFDKGFTGENGRRYSKSTGIGLYLSQKLCKKMNIVLSVSSDPGQGTTVTMVFPTESYLKEAGL